MVKVEAQREVQTYQDQEVGVRNEMEAVAANAMVRGQKLVVGEMSLAGKRSCERQLEVEVQANAPVFRAVKCKDFLGISLQCSEQIVPQLPSQNAASSISSVEASHRDNFS